MSEHSEPAHMYERIADVLRDRILTGELRPGDRLPTQEDLTETFEVSRTVARRALDILEAEGLIDRAQGGRAIVRRYKPLVRRSSLHYKSDPGAPFAEEALATERVPRYSHQSVRDRAGVEVARRLKIAIGDEVMSTEYISYADDTPMMIVQSAEPLAITEGTAIERPEEGPFPGAGIVERFTQIGMRPTSIVERLRCRMPRPSEAERLQLRPGVPVIVITRTSYAKETPIETADLLLAADRYELEYTTRIDPVP